MSDTFQYQTVYFWVFAQECDSRPDGLLVRWISDVRKSKFKDKNTGEPKPDYIEFYVDGDPKKYHLQVESPQVRDYLSKVPRDVLMMAKAGGQDELATIICEDRDGNPILAEGEAKPTQGWGDPKEPTHEDRRGGPVDRLRECSMQVGEIASEFKEKFGRLPTEAEQKMIVTLFLN